MNSQAPDFYLTSSDSTDFAELRECYLDGLVTGETRDDYLLVRIQPTVKDPETGEEIDHVLLAGRYEQFKTVTKSTCVYIMKILSPTVFDQRRCDKTQVKLVAWGEVRPKA